MKVAGKLRGARSMWILAAMVCWLGPMCGLPLAAAPVTTVRPARVCAAPAYTFAIFENGRVLAWGLNDSGQLGMGDTETRRTPEWIPDLAGVTEIACYGDTVFALRADGQVLAWGDNAGGIICQNPAGDVLAPLPFPMPGPVRSLVSSGEHVLAVLADGRMAVWGHNTDGQLGQGYPGETTATPALIPGIADAVAAAATRDSSFALMADGTVWSWGKNSNGELGRTGAGSGANYLVPCPIPSLTGVTLIRGGQQHMLAVGVDPQGKTTLYGWGCNHQGQVGAQVEGGSRAVTTPAVVAIPARPISLAAAGNASMVVTDDGNVYVWGGNAGNVLGTGDPVATTLRAPALHPVLTEVAAGELTLQTGFAIQADGGICGWGENLTYQLGLGDTLARLMPDLVLEGFIYDTTSATGSGHVQSALRIVGAASPLTITVTHPLTLAWSIDPNRTEPFLAPPFAVENHSHCALRVSIGGWAQDECEAASWEDVLPDHFPDWSVIPACEAESKIAIGLRPVAAPGWEPAVPHATCWSAQPGEAVCGTLQADASGVFAWDVRHGLAVTRAWGARHTLVLMFQLN